MTVEEIKRRLAEIRDTVADPEMAHIAEDELHRLTLRAIAKGAERPAELAELALKSLWVLFPRWYA